MLIRRRMVGAQQRKAAYGCKLADRKKIIRCDVILVHRILINGKIGGSL